MAAVFQGFRSLVENSPDAISLLNEEGEILYGSASNTRLFGYTPDELIGRDCMDLIHPEDRDQSMYLLQEVVVKPPGPRRWDARVRHKDGNYSWVESTVSNLIHNLEVQAIVMHQRDIHERREAQQKSQKLAEELTRSNLRMEEFAYTVAHDLREPLRAISLYTQILFSDGDVDAETRQMSDFVIESASRMSKMVADLLAYARTGMQRPHSLVSLNDAISQALKNLALEIQETGAVVTVGKLPTVLSDTTHLVRLFQNLISNALKYRRDVPPEIQVTGELGAHEWTIKIRDNGIGIAAEHRSTIFTPFVRLGHRDVPGTGLGLAVCRKIVENLGGTIWVDSELGTGSTLAFTIPIATAETAATA